MLTIKHLTELGMSEKSAKSMKSMSNFAMIDTLLGVKNTIMPLYDKYVLLEFDENSRYKEICTDVVNAGGDSEVMEQILGVDDNRDYIMETTTKIMEDVINAVMGRHKPVKFRLQGYNKTSCKKTIHTPGYIKEQCYTAGKSGTIELIEMTVDVNIVITRQVRATKKTRGLVEGYYTVDIKRCDEEYKPIKNANMKLIGLLATNKINDYKFE